MVHTDLIKIPGEIVHTEICKTIENKLKSKQFKITVTSASKAGDNNFIGVVYRVSFQKVDENEKNKTWTFILKVAPLNLTRRNILFSRPAFLREIYMYNEVLPYFRQFEQSKGVIENGFIEYPKCYNTIDVEPYESLMLEDLSVRGFQIVDRYSEEISADHVSLIMRTLGKLHAISFALRDQQPEKFNHLTSELNEIFMNIKSEMKVAYTKECEIIYDVLSAEEDADLLAKVKKLYEKNPVDIASDCLIPDEHAVISHGDAWQNNIMFKYDDSGKPKEILLLDWQLSRLSSPIIDVIYFISLCTTKELRDVHYDNFLKIYHESLSEHIRRLGSNPEELFPWDLMIQHFRKYGRFAMFLGTLFLQMITKDKDHDIDLDTAVEGFENGQSNWGFLSDKSRSKYYQRLRELTVDMVRLEYI